MNLRPDRRTALACALAAACVSLLSGCAFRPALRSQPTGLLALGLEARPSPSAATLGAEPSAALADDGRLAATPAITHRAQLASAPSAAAAAPSRPVRLAAVERLHPARALAATASAANPVPVNVRLEAGESGDYEVSTNAGAKCKLPCTLDLPPGPTLLSFSGTRSSVLWVDVPPNGGTMEIAFASSGLRIAKYALVGSAVVLISVGAILTPFLGAIPLLICGGGGLLLLIPGMLIDASDEVKWSPPAAAPPAASAAPEVALRSSVAYARRL